MGKRKFGWINPEHEDSFLEADEYLFGPEDLKRCVECYEIKPFEEFSDPSVLRAVCKACQASGAKQTRLCLVCNEPLPEGSTSRRQYCSTRCRKRAQRAREAGKAG